MKLRLDATSDCAVRFRTDFLPVVGIAAFLVALSSGVETQQAQQPGTRRSPTPIEKISVADLTLQDTQGRVVKLEVAKPTVLNLWTTYCTPCQKQVVVLNQLAAKYHQITFFGISLGEPTEDIRRAGEEYKIKYRLLRGGYKNVVTMLQREVMIPTTLLVGSDGRVREIMAGLELSESVWDQKLSQLVAGK